MYNTLLIGIGIVVIVFTGRIIFDSNYAIEYASESPKTFFWVKLFGKKMTIKLIRYLFAPMGFILGSILIWLAFHK